MNRPKALATVLITAWVSMCSVAVAAGQDLPKGEVILDKSVEASGGKTAFDKLQNQISTATMEFVGKGITATVTSYKARPHQSYAAIEIGAIGTIEQGTSGDVAWERSPLQGPRVKDGEERTGALRDAALYPDWRDQYKNAETAGVETVDGKACYKVIVTPTEGKTETRYYDKSTFLAVKATKIVKSAMGEIPAEITLSDYKQVDGVMIPHTIKQKAIGQEFLISLQSMKHNVEIPKDRFDMPSDIKALVGKSNSAK